MTDNLKKVMVTGASGFIGQHCLPRLVAKGFEVHAISSRSEIRTTAQGVHWHCFDLLNAANCIEAVRIIRPTHLLHLAWIATPGVFWNSEDNLHWLAKGTELVQAFYQYGGKRALGVGSCAEYAWNHDDYNEASTPLRPATVYGRCKLAMSQALETASVVGGGTWAWARLFFPYGPGEPADRLIPTVIRGLLGGEPVACTHGLQVRDFVFVEDVADALVALLDSSVSGAFNIGSGAATTVREVVSVIAARLGGLELVQFGARQAPEGDPEYVVADISKLKESLGWRPAFSLDAGVERSISAWREHLALT